MGKSLNTVLLEIYGKGGCSELSVYIYISRRPGQKDFFCDADISTKPYWDKYNELIRRGEYTGASMLLSTSPIHSYSSGILNFIEAKIKNTQEYVLSKEKYNPYHISDGEPGLKAGEVWL